MLRNAVALVVLAGSVALAAQTASADSFTIDLTHPIPTFKPMDGDPMKPDLNQPWLDSKPIPSFGQQVVLSYSQFPTNQGYFDLGLVVVSGTPRHAHGHPRAHYVNNCRDSGSRQPHGGQTQAPAHAGRQRSDRPRRVDRHQRARAG